MSLTRLLRDTNSNVAQFMRTKFWNTTEFLRDARKQVGRVGTRIIPLERNSHPWITIGHAIDYRIRYHFEVTPYQELVAYQGHLMLPNPGGPVLNIQEFFPDHIQIGVVQYGDRIDFYDKGAARRLGFAVPGYSVISDLPEEVSVDAIEMAADQIQLFGLEELESDSHDEAVYTSFFKNLDRLTGQLNPVGNRLPASQEDELNRYCIVLGLLEQIWREKSIRHSLLAEREFASLEDLLSVAKPLWIEDMRALSVFFYDHCKGLLSLPHILNPYFEGYSDVDGADGDLIVDSTLIDIKTTIKTSIDANWIWQLLGYVLLDYSDEYKINAIALYMARQGLYLRWDLEEALRGLCGEHPPALEELRAEFKEMLQGR